MGNSTPLTSDDILIAQLPPQQRAVWRIANQFRQALIRVVEAESLEEAQQAAKDVLYADD